MIELAMNTARFRSAGVPLSTVISCVLQRCVIPRISNEISQIKTNKYFAVRGLILHVLCLYALPFAAAVLLGNGSSMYENYSTKIIDHNPKI
jgi:hypothetical protein